ncbi:MAG: endonuclease/exonuclease/phosphatase family protein [Treponema sp.]|jgi:endonuclease/exonuclease/phosphatase family metal-dependent hydrolase|nr:endonuclease/exonuclease/phosphatase family protein [Treponema sp.]
MQYGQTEAVTGRPKAETHSGGEAHRLCGGQSTGTLALILLLTAAGCGAEGPWFGASEEGAENIRIMTWNVQAFFDGTERGNEYNKYRGAAWNQEKYMARLNGLIQALDKLEETPDILALEEVENEGVLKDLADRISSSRGYRWTFFAGNPGHSLGLGVLSRIPFTKAAVHSLSYRNEAIPRPVLELWVEIRGSPIALFVCHWKSKLGGEDATGKLRRGAARIILRRMREIGKTHPSMPVLIMGDLNENHDEFYRRNGAVTGALIPDDPEAAEATGFGKTPTSTAQADFLILSGRKPPVPEFFPPDATGLYSPWTEALGEGSYYYRDEWETIDHFLLSSGFFDGSEWEFDGCRVAESPPFVNARGHPNAYNPQTGAGLSDHLPLILTLRFIETGAPGKYGGGP